MHKELSAILTLLHSQWPKLHRGLAALTAEGLKHKLLIQKLQNVFSFFLLLQTISSASQFLLLAMNKRKSNQVVFLGYINVNSFIIESLDQYS